MLRFQWRLATAAVAGLLAAALWQADARAAGFATQKFGGEQGNPVTTNPTALYYNPAGIAFSDGFHLYYDEQVAFRSATYTHQAGPGDPTNYPADVGNTGVARLFNVFSGPTLGATMKFGNLAIGAGLFVPFGGRQHWGTNTSINNSMFPLASEGVQRWHDVDGSLTFLYATAGVAYKLGPLSIGVTGNFIESWIQLTKSQSTAANNLPNSAAEATADIDVKGANGSFGAGVMLEAVPDILWLGASYQARPGLGQQVLKGTFDLVAPGAGGALPTNNVTFTQTMPDIFRAGIRLRPAKTVELRAFGDYTRWSSLQSQCIAIQGNPCVVYPNGGFVQGISQAVLANFPRNWNNTWGVRGGASYWATPAVEIFVGGGYEIGATPNSTLDTSIADADNYQATLGGRFEIGHEAYVSASFTHIQYLDRNNTGQSVYSTYQVPTQQADAGGIYTQRIELLDVNVEKQF